MATPSNTTDGQQNWWYCTHQTQVEGPVSTQHFLSLFSKGYVDGLTIVSNDSSVPRSNWLPLSEHPQLAQAVRDAQLYDAPYPQPDPRPQPETSPRPETSPKPPLPPPSAKTAEQRERKRLSRKRARKAATLRNRQNTSVYVTGLPLDTTEPELAAFFSKCGIILPNPHTGKPRVKLYRADDGALKGDALITYALRPSVENALSILDGVPLRDGTAELSVREATFDHKQTDEGEQEERKKPKLPIRGRDLVDEALSWSEEHVVQKGTAPRIVILKNVFDPSSADYDLIREDMEEGCQVCGEVEKVTVFERNEEGAVAVKFTTVEACLKCINVMNGRWYDGRKLHAAFFDGQTNYTYKETDADRKDREQRWEEWINGNVSKPAKELDFPKQAK